MFKDLYFKKSINLKSATFDLFGLASKLLRHFISEIFYFVNLQNRPFNFEFVFVVL